MEVGPGSEQVPPAGLYVSMLVNGKPGQYMDGVYGAGFVWSDGVKTIGQLAMEAYNATPASISNGNLSFYYVRNMDFCMVWGGVRSPGSYNVPVSDIFSPVPCLYIPPTNNWCKVTTPEIILDHGTLSSSAAEGDVADATMDVECGEAASVKFILPGGYVYLDEGRSTLKVDNKALGSQIALPQGKSTLKISDSLEGVSSAGVHTGTSVLIMQPY